FMRGRTTPLEFRSALRVSQNVGRFIRHQPGEEQTHRLNTSRGRLDVTAEPHLSYRLGQVEDPFVADLFFRPGAEVFLGGGTQAGLRADFIADEGDGRLDRAYVSRFARPRSRRFVLATAFGQIAAGVRAWHGEGLLTSADDRARFGGSISFVGENLFDLDEGRHGRSFLGLLECEVQPLDLTLRASGGQFLSGDRGVRLDLVRRFDEREMTFSGVHTDFGDKWAFNLRVPLGPETLPRPHCGRLRWAEDADVEYRSTILDLGETIDYDFSLRAFRDELSGPYIVQHPEELRRAVTHLRRAGLLPADVSAHVETEPKARPYPTWWPSVLGRSGLVVAPTADTLGDGEYAFGVGFIDRDHTMQFGRTWKRTASIAPYAAFGFLPGLEVGMRYTIYPSLNAYDWGYSTNRAPYAHLRVLRESGRRPALAAFAEDLAGAPVEETYGVVASKRMGSLQLSAGWGSGRFRGVFGGIACPIGRRARVVGEYDSRFVNLGAAVQLDSLRVQLALLNLDGVAAGVSYWGRLH
ncbi:MAG: YjbH domain-containing protein, partial [Armatimonadota bacterium]